MSEALSLFVVQPEPDASEHLLMHGMRIGCGEDCEVRVVHDRLSGVHFTIESCDEGFKLVPSELHEAHSGRRAGTFVNDEVTMSPRLLESGDRISAVAYPDVQHPLFTIGPARRPGTPEIDQMPAVPTVGETAQRIAKSKARNMAMREMKKRLPWFLHPILPGIGGSVQGRVAATVKKRVMAAAFSCLVSLAVLALVGGILGATFLYVAWAIVTG